MTGFIGLIVLVVLSLVAARLIFGAIPASQVDSNDFGQDLGQGDFCPHCGLQISMPPDLDSICLGCGANLLDDCL